MLALMLGQIPRMLESPLALRAVKRPLSGMSELMPPDVRRPGERLTTGFTGESLLSAVKHFPSTFIVHRLCSALLCVSSGEKLYGCKYFI